MIVGCMYGQVIIKKYSIKFIGKINIEPRHNSGVKKVTICDDGWVEKLDVLFAESIKPLFNNAGWNAFCNANNNETIKPLSAVTPVTNYVLPAEK